MTLWFVFAMMTAAAIFAVLWPLGRGSRAAARGQRGRRLQGSARRSRSRRRGRADRRRRKPTPPGSRSAAGCCAAADAERRAPAASQHRVAPRASRCSRWSGCRSLAVAFYLPLGSPRLRRLSAGRSAAARRARRSRSTTWWRRSRRIWRRTRPMAAAGPCWRRCWRRLGRFDDAVARLSQFDHLRTATAPSAAPISAKRWPMRGGRRDHRRGQGRIRTRGGAERRRGQGALFPRPGRRAGRPRRRMPRRSGARCWTRRRPMRRGGRWCRPRWRGSAAPPLPALSDDAMAAGKDMSEADRDAMIRGMVERLADAAEAERRRRRGMAAAGACLYGDGRSRQGQERAGRGASGASAAMPERLRQLNEGLKNLGLDG